LGLDGLGGTLSTSWRRRATAEGLERLAQHLGRVRIAGKGGGLVLPKVEEAPGQGVNVARTGHGASIASAAERRHRRAASRAGPAAPIGALQHSTCALQH
jgi:hypothetical protein